MISVEQLGQKAKIAERTLAAADHQLRNQALAAMAAGLEKDAPGIIQANRQDLAAGEAAGLSKALLDRLALNEERIAGIAQAIRKIISLPDPLGRELEKTVRPNGLLIRKVSVPIGVIAVIFEARPNVTADSAALCIKSGNAVILRGGKEAIRSNQAMVASMQRAISSVGLPEDCILLVEDTTHESANALMHLNEYIDLLIPRGGSGLIKTVVENSTVPVIETGAGTCHTYVAASADPQMAADIIYNAKVSRPSVCNACECMLIHKDAAAQALPLIAKQLLAAGVEIRGDEKILAMIPQAIAARENDWGKEYNDYIIAARIVDSTEDAIEHIRKYGTGHSECIVTADEAEGLYFQGAIDAAAVYVNASTRFTDGGEFGLGAEIGISTQKLHARGPLGLRELTSAKYLINGTGQIR